MRNTWITVVVGVVAVLALASCGSSGSKASSAETPGVGASTAPGATGSSAPGSSSTTAANGGGGGSGGGWPGAHGCDSPSAADVGTAFGTPITKSIPSADDGCLWEAGPGRGVQVSYHTPDNDPMSPVQLNVLHSTLKVTDLSISGAQQAFIRTIQLPGQDNPIAYVVYPEGVVQVAFNGPAGTLDESHLEATVNLIVKG